MNQRAAWTIRDIDRRTDTAEVLGLDTSYTTEAAERSAGGKKTPCADTSVIEEFAGLDAGGFLLELDWPKMGSGFCRRRRWRGAGIYRHAL